MGKALDGIRVIDFTHDQAGPSCTQMLAWLGADVIKIERPGIGDRARRITYGDQDNLDSYFFLTLNNNKRSTTLNLKTDEGKEIARRLIRAGDVVAENLGPGVMDRLGLGYEGAKAINPKIIYASVKGFGSFGPYSDYKCFETVAQAMSGAMSVTGYPDGEPTVIGANVGDSGTGMHLAIAILGALVQRERTGVGQCVEVAMQESVLNVTRIKFVPTMITGKPHLRTGNGSATGTFATLVRCAGGGPNDYAYLMVAPDNPEAFTSLLEVIGREELRDDERFNTPKARARNAAEFTAVVEAWTMERDKRDVMRVLAGRGIACGPVLDTVEVLADPHLRERGMVFDMEHPTRGRLPMIGCPVRLSESPVESRRAPRLGEHNEEVLVELAGYTPEDVERLRSEKVI